MKLPAEIMTSMPSTENSASDVYSPDSSPRSARYCREHSNTNAPITIAPSFSTAPISSCTNAPEKVAARASGQPHSTSAPVTTSVASASHSVTARFFASENRPTTSTRHAADASQISGIAGAKSGIGNAVMAASTG